MKIYDLFVRKRFTKLLSGCLNFGPFSLKKIPNSRYTLTLLWDERLIFLIPHSLYLKKKSFHLLKGTINTFWELKGQKCKKPLNISKNGFSKLKQKDRLFIPNQLQFSHWQTKSQSDFWPVGYRQCCGSMKFWCGSGIRGSIPLNNRFGCGSGSCYFRQLPSRHQQKLIFFLIFWLITFWRYIYIIYQR
jgi:hypothetical protein